MAKIIYAYSRQTPFGPGDDAKLRKICERLEPDNLRLPVPHKVMLKGQLACAVINNRNTVFNGSNVLLGCLYGKNPRWETPNTDYPDGSYAIFREDAHCVEAVSDAAASRTIWYYFDDTRFIAATSQRAIVMFLGSFEFDERVIPWMLSTGSLGPSLSWDKRIRRLPPDSSVVLDKEQWLITVNRQPVVFSPKKRSHAGHKEQVANEVRAVIKSLNRPGAITFNDYVLPLSGGYDSRGILCFLAENGVPANLKTITWGLEKNLTRERNDAAVARELATRLGVAHRYFHTDIAKEPMEQVIDRFIHCGEGRVDHLSGYMDGLEIWRKLLEEEQCSGIIRGDEGFGWIPVSSELTVRYSVGISLCSDFRNMEGLVEKYGFPKQELPEELQRKKGETLHAWRDRLYHAYRMPTILSALSDIKYSYVDIINPLLARSILRRVRELPDNLRTDKILFREIVDSVSPKVPYANEGANASPARILRKKAIVDLMRNKMRSEGATCIFDSQFLDAIARGIRDEEGGKREVRARPWSRLKSLVPRSVKNWVRDLLAKPILDGNVLAFRVFLVLRMHEVLMEDCSSAPQKKGTVPDALSPDMTRSRLAENIGL